MARLYPMFVSLEGRKTVVIGGGKVAQRKVEVLLGCGAEVAVISPEVTEELADWERAGRVRIEQRGFEAGDTGGAWLVIAASGEEEVNRRVFAEAEEGGIFCNVVDVPELCSFQVPAVVQRGAMQIAISTGGVSPALAKRIRKELEVGFGPWYETFLAGLSELREHIKGKYPEDQGKRAGIFEGFVNSEALEKLREGGEEAYRRILEEWREK
jgi:precorrin-2 dehydrogenase